MARSKSEPRRPAPPAATKIPAAPSAFEPHPPRPKRWLLLTSAVLLFAWIVFLLILALREAGIGVYS